MMPKQPAFWWPLSLLATAAVALLLLWPGQHLPEGPKVPGFDKAVHVLLFGGLALCWLCLAAAYGRLSSKAVWRILLGVSAYGLVLEWAQQAIAVQRSFDWWDWLADSLGILLAWPFMRAAATRGFIPSGPESQNPSAPGNVR